MSMPRKTWALGSVAGPKAKVKVASEVGVKKFGWLVECLFFPKHFFAVAIVSGDCRLTLLMLFIHYDTSQVVTL